MTEMINVSMNEDEWKKRKNNGILYEALIKEEKQTVIQLCKQFPEGALHILTVHKDTVLHMAAYAQLGDLTKKLLDDVPDVHLDKMTRQNHIGNTVLHEAATSSDVALAEAVLQIAPGLLGMINHDGETALFRAVRYGKTKVFRFLSEKISTYDPDSQQAFLQNKDKTTILHAAVQVKRFGLAKEIAVRYNHLIAQEDGDQMTPLQLLSLDKSAFTKDTDDGFFKLFINYIKSCCSGGQGGGCGSGSSRGEGDEAGLELAKVLIRADASWEATYAGLGQSKLKTHKYGSISRGSFMEERPTEATTPGSIPTAGGAEHIGETPLFLATKTGNIEIVQQILALYPQAIEYIDDEGRNIIHVAIKYRQVNIFDYVLTMEVPLKRLKRQIDNQGNTILHMVGTKRKEYVPEKMLSPALQLQDELIWFERVKEHTLPHLLDQQNNEKKTAYALFESENSDLRNAAKEWLCRTSEGCSILAVLIATVAFAATYTVPGGPNQSTGLPVLLSHPFFVVFTVTDGLSLAFALTAVVLFMSILTSSFRFRDFSRSLPKQLTLGFTFLFFSVVMMMIAFAATIMLMIHQKESWAKIILYCVAFLPVLIFALTYSPLYSSLASPREFLWKKFEQAFLITDFRTQDRSTSPKPDDIRTSSNLQV